MAPGRRGAVRPKCQWMLVKAVNSSHSSLLHMKGYRVLARIGIAFQYAFKKNGRFLSFCLTTYLHIGYSLSILLCCFFWPLNKMYGLWGLGPLCQLCLLLNLPFQGSHLVPAFADRWGQGKRGQKLGQLENASGFGPMHKTAKFCLVKPSKCFAWRRKEMKDVKSYPEFVLHSQMTRLGSGIVLSILKKQKQNKTKSPYYYVHYQF